MSTNSSVAEPRTVRDAVLVPRPGAERRARPERADRDGDQRPAEQPEPAVEQAPGQSEHRSDAQQKHRAVGDRAFIDAASSKTAAD